MDSDGLFSLDPPARAGGVAPHPASGGFDVVADDAPLAVRMRPASVDELVGQDHLLAAGAPLRQLVGSSAPMSVILWGPPGTGKTTIAHLVAGATDRTFVALSALNAGVKDVRAVIDAAKTQRRRGGAPTVLFIDEVHRFSKTQQDSLLAAVEDRTVTLLAATTENPYFSIISPLLSRCVLLTLQPLGEDAVRGLIKRAIDDPRGLGGAVTSAPDAEDHLVRLASGDVRKALTALEAAASSAVAKGVTEIDLATAEQAVDVAAVRYDRDGDEHYDVISAFIKSMRGSDVDAALHYLARMLVAGEDPRFIARRLVIFASEDVGMADPTALPIGDRGGLGGGVDRAARVPAQPGPGRDPHGHRAEVERCRRRRSRRRSPTCGPVTPVRCHAICVMRITPAPAVSATARATVTRTTTPVACCAQQYPPDALVGRDYYHPVSRRQESGIAERLPRLRAAVRGLPSPGTIGSGRCAGQDRPGRRPTGAHQRAQAPDRDRGGPRMTTPTGGSDRGVPPSPRGRWRGRGRDDEAPRTRAGDDSRAAPETIRCADSPVACGPAPPG